MKRIIGLIAFVFALVGVSIFAAMQANAAGSTVVKWCVYEDGTLVINGDNTPNYKNHGNIVFPTNPRAYEINTADIDREYGGLNVPWIEPLAFGWADYEIKSVEFAKPTKPKNMQYWFYDIDDAGNRRGLPLESIDSTNLDTSEVTNMKGLFKYCASLSDISSLASWNTSNVTSMSYVFCACSAIDDFSPISGWDVSKVTNMSEMFNDCSSFSDFSPLSGWDVSSVTDMSGMFFGCQGLKEINLSSWNVDSLQRFDSIFRRCSNLKTIWCDKEWSYTNSWDSDCMFDGCTSLSSSSSEKSYDISQVGGTMANPWTGYFSAPVIATYIPKLQKQVKDSSGALIEDWDFEKAPFSFEISYLSGSTPSGEPEIRPLPSETEATTDSEGNVTWPEIKFYEPGTYIYEITEKEGDVEGVTYDTESHEMKVTVNSRPSLSNGIPQTQEEFNATSWEDMAKLAARCASEGTADYEHLLGFTKDVDVEGVGVVKAKLIGLNHDTYTEGGTAGFTFQLTDGLSTSKPVSMKMNTSATVTGGWRDSLMRNTNMPALLAALPSDLRSLIKKVTKKSSTTYTGTDVVETEDDLFLLSLVESIGTTTTAYTGNPVAMHSPSYLENEGTQYEYYKLFDSTSTEAFNHHIIKADTGGAQRWWLRSIGWNHSTYFCSMYSSGDRDNLIASGLCLPAAAFCL